MAITKQEKDFLLKLKAQWVSQWDATNQLMQARNSWQFKSPTVWERVWMWVQMWVDVAKHWVSEVKSWFEDIWWAFQPETFVQREWWPQEVPKEIAWKRDVINRVEQFWRGLRNIWAWALESTFWALFSAPIWVFKPEVEAWVKAIMETEWWQKAAEVFNSLPVDVKESIVDSAETIWIRWAQAWVKAWAQAVKETWAQIAKKWIQVWWKNIARNVWDFTPSFREAKVWINEATKRRLWKIWTETFDRYKNAALAREANDLELSALWRWAEDVWVVIKDLEKWLRETWGAIWDFRKKIWDIKVDTLKFDNVLKNLDNALKKDWLVVWRLNKLVPAKWRSPKFSSAEISHLEWMRQDILRLKQDPNIVRNIDIRTKFDRQANFKKSSQEVSNLIDPFVKSARNDLKKINEWAIWKTEAAKLKEYSDIIWVIEDFKQMTSWWKNTEFLLRRLLSNRDRLPKEVVKSIEEITWQDILSIAKASQVATELYAWPEQLWLFRQEIWNAWIDVMSILNPKMAAAWFVWKKALDLFFDKPWIFERTVKEAEETTKKLDWQKVEKSVNVSEKNKAEVERVKKVAKSENFSNLVKEIKDQWWITLDLQSQKNLWWKPFIAVSPYPNRSKIIKLEDFNTNSLWDYIKANKKKLLEKWHTFWAWVDEWNVYLDVALAIPKKFEKEAVTLWKKYNQKAIFDLENFKEIDTWWSWEKININEAEVLIDINKIIK